MKKIVLALLAMHICLSFYAFADEYDDTGFYAKLFGGVNLLQTENHSGIKPSFHPGYMVSGAVGYQWCHQLRAEFEYAFRRNIMSRIHFFGQDFKTKGSFQSSSYMANLLWDCLTWDCVLRYVQPFVGAGIGYDVQQFHTGEEGFRLNQNRKGFAWQLMAGFNYPICSNTEISLEYKFHKGPLENIYSHVIGIGFTYKFNWDCCEECQ